MICPHHCVCQYAHRMDLSISRWIHAVETRQRKGHEFTDSSEDSLNNNEVSLLKKLLMMDNHEPCQRRSASTMMFCRITMSC